MATTATVGSRCVNYPILIQEGSYRKFVACTYGTDANEHM